VEGDAKVGETLIAKVTPEKATVYYQWMRSDTEDGTYVAIDGATSKTYILTEADAGKYLKVEVKGTGNYTGTKTKVVGPIEASEAMIAAAKATFLAALIGKVGEIKEADVAILGEDIIVGFDENADVDAVYGVVTDLLAAFRAELKEASLTVKRAGDAVGATFTLDQDHVVVDLARYLLGDLTPEQFLAQREAVEASYTATATNNDNVEFGLEGELLFTADLGQAAKVAFLATLKEKAEAITVADVTIVGEDISVTFASDADVDAVYGVVTELLAAFRAELKEASLTVKRAGDAVGATFTLDQDHVVVDLARYLLGDLTPEQFLAQREAVEATYTAQATDNYDVEFGLEGNLKFQTIYTEAEAKADFLSALEEKAEAITVADVTIVGEDISVTFASDANVDAVYGAVEDLLAAFRAELKEASLTVKRAGDAVGATFTLDQDHVVVDLARYLLGDLTPEQFLAQREAVEASYTATATDNYEVEFGLEGNLKFQPGEEPGGSVYIDEKTTLDQNYDTVNVIGDEIEVDLGGHTARVLTITGNGVTLKNGTVIELTITEDVENVVLVDISDGEGGMWTFAGGGSGSIVFKGTTAPKGTIIITAPTPIEIRSESDGSEITGNIVVKTIESVVVDTPVRGKIEVQAASDSITIKKQVKKSLRWLKRQ
jgi:SAM-dependent methyltransferase